MTKSANEYHSIDKFFSLFPTPKFLEMPAPGLSIDDSFVRLIEFERRKGELALKRHASGAIPEGILKNGQIIDATGLTAILADFRKKHDLRHIRCSLPEEEGYLFRGRIPKLNSTGEVRTAVEFIIEENVPLSVSESVFDYEIIQGAESDDHMDVSVSVVPENVVRTYIEVFRNAGLSPLHFEIESQAVTKAIIPRNDMSGYLVFNLMRDRTGIYVVSENSVQYSSTLALTVRRESSSAPLPIEELRGEIRKVLSYWDTQMEKIGLKKKIIDTIIVVGFGAHENKILSDLRDLNLNIVPANVWVNALSFKKEVPSIPRSEAMEYGAAIGLALPHRIKV